MRINKEQIDTILLDFDGVLTDNKVTVDQTGKEYVQCNRSDGLAIRALKKKKYKFLVISSERNNVVKARCKKLKIKCINAIEDKKICISKLAARGILDLSKTLYIGNDLNDYYAMKLCILSCCPYDSHKKIKKIADYTLLKKGGEGVLMEIAEKILKIDVLKYL